jgi:hypothetical protein
MRKGSPSRQVPVTHSPAQNGRYGNWSRSTVTKPKACCAVPRRPRLLKSLNSYCCRAHDVAARPIQQRSSDS